MSAFIGADNSASARTGDSGFTLMETLVALVIFTACYVLIQQGLSLGWRGVNLARSETAALQVAQAQLSATGFESPLTEGQSVGESAGYRWTVDVRRRDADDSRSESGHLEGFWVTVEVSWQDAASRRPRSIQLTTLKLMSRP